MDTEITNNHQLKPRKMWKALLFSFLCAGMGQIYNGQVKKFFVVFACLILVPLFFDATKLSITFYGCVVLYAIFISLILYLIIDACINARKLKNYVPKSYNKWYFHLLFGVLIIIAMWFFFKSPMSLQNYFVRHFKTTAISSEPTLLIGDHIVADMQAYKYKNPDYGDIVVFNNNNIFWIYRVVGQPNDTISIVDNLVKIKNKTTKSSLKETVIIDDITCDKYEEILPNGHKYLIYKYSDFSSEKANIDNIIVPNDCYFLLGDNRDEAFDSRYIGVVNREQIKGKATYILFGKEVFKRYNIDLTK